MLHTETQKAYARAIAGAFCLSFSPLFVNWISIGSTGVAFYRIFFGALGLLCVSLWRGERLIPPLRIAAILLAASLFFNGDLQCWHKSIRYLGPGLATIIVNLQVFFIAIAGALWFNERLTLRHFFAMCLAVLGVYLIVGMEGGPLPAQVSTGIILALVAALFYTGYILCLHISQRTGNRLHPAPNLAIVCMITAATLAPFGMAEAGGLAIPNLTDGALLLVYGLGSQTLGWLLLSSAMPHLPASKTGLILLLQPALSFIWDILFFGRPTTIWSISGATLAITAIYLGISAPTKRKDNKGNEATPEQIATK